VIPALRRRPAWLSSFGEPSLFLLASILTLSRASSAQTTAVNLGGLTLLVSSSPTAQVFHIVDQLSQWDQYAHKQYIRWAAAHLTLNDTDRQLLARHAAMRKARGWGGGFEQAFLTDAPIGAAAKSAVAQGLLTADEAESERTILEHFAPILHGLLEERRGAQDSLLRVIKADTTWLRPVVSQLMRFTETAHPVTIPVFLVANSDSANGGGESNGGRVVIEVPGPDLRGVTLHEALHFLLSPHAAAIQAAADSAGLPFDQVNEGVAYALQGLVQDSTQGDVLLETLVQLWLGGARPADAYARFYMTGVVFRPLLRKALESGGTIDTFLPGAMAKWKRVAAGTP